MKYLKITTGKKTCDVTICNSALRRILGIIINS